MRSTQPPAHTRAVPRYALYGDAAQARLLGQFHYERIPQRSRLYQWEIRPHTHDAFVQLLLLEQGACALSLNGRQQHLAAPCLVLVPAQNVHGFRFTPDADGPVVTVACPSLETLATLLAPELLGTLRHSAVLPLPPAGQDDAAGRAGALLRTLFAALEQEWRLHAPGHTAAGLALLAAIIAQVARLQRALPAAAPSALPGALPPPQAGAPVTRQALRVERFKSLVNDKFAQRLPLSTYAGRLGVSVGQLTRCCREVLGVSALQVINTRVLHEAQRDLVYTRGSIGQVADALGFADEAYFGRFFRKHTGLSPKAFRAQARQAMAQG